MGYLGRTSDIPVRVVLSNKDIESVEQDNHGEVQQGEPSSVWGEMGSENERVSINALSLERTIELDVRNAD